MPHRNCVVCGTAFSGERLSCSKECLRALHSRNSRSRTPPRLCKVCGAPTPRAARAVCGPACLSAAKNAKRALPSSKRRNAYGYVLVRAPGHPAATKSGQVLEHRLVMEQKLGRRLLPRERVHHKNAVRHDNRAENLELWVTGTKDPTGARASDLWMEVLRQPELSGLHPAAIESFRAAFARAFGFCGTI